MTTPASEPGTKQIRIDPDLHRDAKVTAAKLGLTLREFVEAVIATACVDVRSNLEADR